MSVALTSAAAPAAALPLWKRLALGFVGLELIALYGPTLVWLYERWTLSVWHHAHGLMIPPVVAWFIHQELSQRRGLPVASSAWGLAFVLPALALHVLDAGMHTQLLSAVSLVVLLPGLSLLFLGWERTRAILFPLAFLAFAMPIPLAFTASIHMALRQVATAGTAAILPWLGVSVFVEGTTLHMAHGVVQVADACSGFSTLYASLAVACLTAYSTNRTSRRVAVLAMAAPVAMAANLIRVVLLVMLMMWYGEAILDTWVHPASGMLTFAIALPILFWLGRPAAPSKAA